jgi:3-oxoacyl-[acyl-carrier protein] reductase
MKDLVGKVCFVTGATHGTHGLGRATASLMAEHDADEVVNFQNSHDLAEDVCQRVRQIGVRAIACQANIANEHQVESMLDGVSNELGTVSILVNNAGITQDKLFLKMTRVMWV